jgi:hypothetical protein
MRSFICSDPCLHSFVVSMNSDYRILQCPIELIRKGP